VSRAVVAGALANRPGNGGGAAVRLDWLRGLRRLGLDVWFVEQIDRAGLEAAGANGSGQAAPPAESAAANGSRQTAPPAAVEFFDDVVRRHGFAGRAALLDLDGEHVAGIAPSEIADAADGALLVNLSGHLTLPTLLGRFARRVYVDLDPGYTQIWHAEGHGAARLEGHDAWFTVGLNVGTAACPIPTGGIAWRPLPPPVVLEDWPVTPADLDAFTTVASWRGSFGRLEHAGHSWGAKAHELRKLLDLPAHAPAPLEIALAIDPGDEADRIALREHGWRLVDPRRVAGDPDSYRSYVQASGAELSAAQGVYVETRSGWISDRTVRYLASGRPALVQDTGLDDHVPVGDGLLTFRTFAEAAAGAAAIGRDFPAHCRAARAIAEACFDSDRVLGRFLDEVWPGARA
jgi:hypothetical protein